MKSAWVSFVATTLGMALWMGPLFIDWNDWGLGQLYCFGALSFLVGQGATVLTFIRIVRLKMAGMKERCWKPVLLALPGIIVSTLIALSMTGIAVLLQSRA